MSESRGVKFGDRGCRGSVVNVFYGDRERGLKLEYSDAGAGIKIRLRC